MSEVKCNSIHLPGFFNMCTGDCMEIEGKWLIVPENVLRIRWHKVTVPVNFLEAESLKEQIDCFEDDFYRRMI